MYTWQSCNMLESTQQGQKHISGKINLLRCQEGELHLDVALDHVAGSFVGVGVHLAVLKPVPVNSA